MPNYINNLNMLNFSRTQSTPSTPQSSSETNTANNNEQHNWGSISNMGVSAERNNRGNDLDRDAFLRLLMTQLQFQDPLNPMEDTDFIAQLAQFSALEQMQNMNSNTLRTQAFNMVGTEVMADVRNEQTNTIRRVQGHVEGVTIKNGEPLLSINGVNVSMNDVIAVGLDPTLSIISGINNQLFTSQNMELIGQYAQFLQKDKEGEIIGFIEGKIDSIKFTQDGPMAVIGTKEVSASELKTVSRTPLLIGRVITGITSDNETITGPIKDVLVNNGRISLVLENGRVSIDNITHVTDSLRHVSAQITHDGTTRVVESVRIRRGTPYLVLDNNEEISFLDFAGIKQDEEDR